MQALPQSGGKLDSLPGNWLYGHDCADSHSLTCKHERYCQTIRHEQDVRAGQRHLQMMPFMIDPVCSGFLQGARKKMSIMSGSCYTCQPCDKLRETLQGSQMIVRADVDNVDEGRVD